MEGEIVYLHSQRGEVFKNSNHEVIKQLNFANVALRAFPHQLQ